MVFYQCSRMSLDLPTFVMTPLPENSGPHQHPANQWNQVNVGLQGG
ncbi:hypothetical protein Hanom_Chr02g00169931 [Helianthus anomalus]